MKKAAAVAAIRDAANAFRTSRQRWNSDVSETGRSHEGPIGSLAGHGGMFARPQVRLTALGLLRERCVGPNRGSALRPA